MLGLDSDIPKGCLGPKAEYVWKLHGAGFKVPESVFIPMDVGIDDNLVVAVLEVFKENHTSLVVRSSSVHEDGVNQSMAGLFRSVLNVPVEHDALMLAMTECRNHTPIHNNLQDQEIGLVVQEMITPRVSGLMFTEDPTDQNSGLVLEWVEGHLESLVQGEVEGERRRIERKDCLSGNSEYVPFSELQVMTSAIAELEAITAGPADIEWAISGGDCYILQIRPISSHQIGHLPNVMDLSLHQTYSNLPQRIRNHHKIAFREVCAINRLPIAYGNLITLNSDADMEEIASVHRSWGNSMAVLLTPQRIEGEIQRISFVGNNIDSLLKFLEELKQHCPRFTVLTKELQETAYTGLALIDGNEGEIEIGAGHFLSKGLADPWRFKIEGDQVIFMNEEALKSMVAIQIEQGLFQEDRSEIEPPSLSQVQDILGIVREMQQYYPKHCIEFGIEPDGTSFLIDHYPSEMQGADSEGVLSQGSFTGKIMRIERDDVVDSIDSHFHDVRLGEGMVDVVLVADRPRLSLVKHLPAEGGTMGCLFESGSRLCHLAVLLRERGIPAMFVGERYNQLENGGQASFDTSTGLLSID
ncbi:MAG: PEP/pyruvate-binding domain-containing protein [Candidatus Thermoplasmatota archaeon]|nr:PEP/pyruvate-binding domain-containing protein [Candidatus Thermoplasmatota archaeon]